MDKLILFIKKYGLWIIVVLLIIICLICLPSLFVSKKPIDGITNIVDKTRKEIDKVDTEIQVKKVEVAIKNEVVEKKKEETLKQLEDIKAIPQAEIRRKKVIELHEKIKKFK